MRSSKLLTTLDCTVIRLKSLVRKLINFIQVDANNDETISFEDVGSIVKKFGSVLAKRGIQNQDVVAVCISNSIYYPTLIMGISALNAITTPCNPNYTKGKKKRLGK